MVGTRTFISWFGLGVGVLVAVAATAQAPNLDQMDLVLKAIPNGPVGFVNGKPIDAVEFRDFYKGEVIRWAQMNSASSVPDAVRLRLALNSLRLLIEREILVQEAAKRKVTVPESEVQERWKKELDGMAKSVARDKDQAPTEDEILKLAGTDKAHALDEFRKALVIQKMRELIAKEKGVDVTDKEVSDFYAANKERTKLPDTIHVKQVFTKAPTGPTGGGAGLKPAQDQRAQGQARIEKALKRIQSGESFEAVAKDVCDGPLKESAGDMGPVPVSDMPPFLVEQAAKLQPGQLSGIIESPYGFHIIRLVESVAGGDQNLDSVSPDIRRYLLNKKMNDVVQRYCDDVTGPDSIQVFLDVDKQLATRPELSKEFADVLGVPPEGDTKAAPKSAPKTKPAAPSNAQATPEQGAKKKGTK